MNFVELGLIWFILMVLFTKKGHTKPEPVRIKKTRRKN